ncbi:MAG TPA: tRNA glutamyl-Q(34) synthetase GluQRS [Opitutaceae bacterium]|nr:tRNA glutamyl-Q(34) synthetase GluQRS [Opitutaceae bacterium]
MRTPSVIYRGRIAPSPTGYLHLGHARTFWLAHERARQHGGENIFRNDDLDTARCRPEYAAAAIEDLRWLGLTWTEGPDIGGPHAPYEQSRRRPLYRQALEALHAQKLIFPCTRSRRDVLEAAAAPHESNGELDEPIYPKHFRPAADAPLPLLGEKISVNWRFRVPDDAQIGFVDQRLGAKSAVSGRDFGDFLVWRKDDMPAYQLACVVDDALMRITEVVRGEDLVTSTFRQLLLFQALGWAAPAYYHCPLMHDEHGARLAKRHEALALRTLRAQGADPVKLTAGFSAVVNS